MRYKLTSMPLAIVVWALLLLSACAVNPVTGRQELQLLGADWEVATGRQSYAPLQQQSGGLYKAEPAWRTTWPALATA